MRFMLVKKSSHRLRLINKAPNPIFQRHRWLMRQLLLGDVLVQWIRELLTSLLCHKRVIHSNVGINSLREKRCQLTVIFTLWVNLICPIPRNTIRNISVEISRRLRLLEMTVRDWLLEMTGGEFEMTRGQAASAL